MENLKEIEIGSTVQAEKGEWELGNDNLKETVNNIQYSLAWEDTGLGIMFVVLSVTLRECLHQPQGMLLEHYRVFT